MYFADRQRKLIEDAEAAAEAANNAWERACVDRAEADARAHDMKRVEQTALEVLNATERECARIKSCVGIGAPR